MSTADDVREAEESAAAHLFVNGMGSLVAALENIEKDPTKAAQGMDSQALADSTALVQDLRYRLGLVERDLAVALGKREGKIVGALSDGRQFTLDRSSDRKEWQHDDWKRDVRRAVVTQTIGGHPFVVVNQETGQEFPLANLLQAALAEAQEIHGAQAPKSTALKTLGLYASDYCTSTPGGWRFAAVKPTPTEDTTKEPTDA